MDYATDVIYQSDTGPVTHCPSCGAASLRRSTISSIFWRGDVALMVRSIPAFVCDSCGEDFVSDATVGQLDQIKATRFEAPDTKVFVQVPVLDFGQVPLVDRG